MEENRIKPYEQNFIETIYLRDEEKIKIIYKSILKICQGIKEKADNKIAFTIDELLKIEFISLDLRNITIGNDGLVIFHKTDTIPRKLIELLLKTYDDFLVHKDNVDIEQFSPIKENIKEMEAIMYQYNFCYMTTDALKYVKKSLMEER